MNKLASIGSFLMIVGALGIGCKMQGAVEGPGGGSGGGDGYGEVDDGSGAAGGNGGAGGPSCPNADNHCLDEDTYFVGDQRWEGGYATIFPAKMQGQANASGEANFLLLGDGEERTSQYFWRSRPAGADDLKVGQLVIVSNHADDNVYRAPHDRAEAHQSWWMGRIVSVEPVAQRSQVVLASGYMARTDALRIPLEASLETVVVTGSEDGHFLQPDHWVVSDGPLPKSGYHSAAIGAPIQAPSAATKGDGHFINLHDGVSRWTKHAWRTRAATKDDLKMGAVVFVFNGTDDAGNYRAPNDRVEALTQTWWVGKITDVGELYKNVVTVAGDYRVNVGALRVQVK